MARAPPQGFCYGPGVTPSAAAEAPVDPNVLAPRRPALALLLSLLFPGLGHLYLGRPVPAFALAIANHALVPVVQLAWAHGQASAKFYGLAVWLGVLVMRAIAAPLAYVAAKNAPTVKRAFHHPGAYGAFALGFVWLGGLAGDWVTKHVAETALVANDAFGFLPGDQLLVRKVEGPRAGQVAVVANDARAPQGPMREVRVARVTRVEAGGLVLEGEEALTPLELFRGEAGDVFFSVGPDRKPRWSRLGLSPLKGAP